MSLVVVRRQRLFEPERECEKEGQGKGAGAETERLANAESPQRTFPVYCRGMPWRGCMYRAMELAQGMPEGRGKGSWEHRVNGVDEIVDRRDQCFQLQM